MNVDVLKSEPVLVLTVDVDWSPNACIEDTLAIIRAAEVPATVFATAGTPYELLDGFDIGIHPDFRGATQDAKGIESELTACLTEFPRATGLRSHALVTSSRHALVIRDGFGAIKYTSNYYMPGVERLAPFLSQAGIPELPIWWMDHLYLEAQGFCDCDLFMAEFNSPGLKVIDLHPFHVFINSQDREHFQSARRDYHHARLLESHRRAGPGVRELLLSLLDQVRSRKWTVHSCTSLLRAINPAKKYRRRKSRAERQVPR
jgi:hypothetical protein